MACRYEEQVYQAMGTVNACGCPLCSYKNLTDCYEMGGVTMETIKRGTKEFAGALNNAIGATLYTPRHAAGIGCKVEAVRTVLAKMKRLKLEYIRGEFIVRIDKRRRFVLKYEPYETV